MRGTLTDSNLCRVSSGWQREYRRASVEDDDPRWLALPNATLVPR